MGSHVSHMCSHVAHMCCSDFTRLPTCEVDFSHLRHMLVLKTNVDIVCSTCNPHVATLATCEAHAGSHLLALRPHVKRICEIGITNKLQMWISCDFFCKRPMSPPPMCCWLNFGEGSNYWLWKYVKCVSEGDSNFQAVKGKILISKQCGGKHDISGFDVNF